MDRLTGDQNDAVTYGHGEYLVLCSECVMHLTQRLEFLGAICTWVELS